VCGLPSSEPSLSATAIRTASYYYYYYYYYHYCYCCCCCCCCCFLLARKMGAAGSVCHRLCHQTMVLSTKGMRESKKSFPAQTVKAQTVNRPKCCFAGLQRVKHLRAKDMNNRSLHIVCVSVTCWYISLHCCTELSFTVQQSSLNALRVFNLQFQGYNCDKFHSNRFSSVGDKLRKRRGWFFLNTVYKRTYHSQPHRCRLHNVCVRRKAH